MILVNGQTTDQVSTADRGLLYGDGVFETLAVRDGQPLLWSEHLQRLISSCERLAIQLHDTDTLLNEALLVCKGNPRAVLKIIITRGTGGRGYRFDISESRPTRIVALHPWPDYPVDAKTRGVRVRVCATRLIGNPLLAGMKHLNRLEQVLARNEWQDPLIAEGIMLDAAGHVVEGTASNVFWVRDGVLHTPDLSECGVAGVMRNEIIIQSKKWSIPCVLARINIENIMKVEEIFLCNSLIGIWPVRELDDAIFPIGPLTKQIITHLDRVVVPC
jgi:4-amino-4-deoxychorismate lyase